MNKVEFLEELQNKLKGLPKSDIDNRIEFYDEMIDDMCQEGLTEEQAIEKLGGVDEVVKQIASETTLISLVKEKTKPNRSLRGWEIAMLIVGFPLWFPLLITFLSLCLVAYILVWVLVIVTYSVTISVVAATIVGVVMGFGGLFAGNVPAFGFYMGCAIAGLGLTILLFYACKYATVLTLKLAKAILLKIKLSFIRKEKENE